MPPGRAALQTATTLRLRNTGRLRDELEDVVAARPDVDDLPVAVAHQLLLGVRPRLSRTLMPWLGFRPLAFGLHDVVDELDPADTLAAPGLAAALLPLLTLPSLWPRVVEVARGGSRDDAGGFIAHARAAGLDDDLRRDWMAVARETCGDLERALLPDCTLQEALGFPRAAPWARSAIICLAAMADVRRLPLQWPVVLTFPEVLADERRALLARLGRQRAGREPGRWHVREVKAGKRAIFFELRGFDWHTAVVEVRPRSGEVVHASPDDPAVRSAALGWLFDMINEPAEHELSRLRDWLAPTHDALLAALDAYVAAEAPKEERIAWELQAVSAGTRLVCRRQRPKVNGKGWVKGVDVEPARLLAESSPAITDQDRRVAGFLASSRPDATAALQALAGHPFLVDSDGRPATVESLPLRVSLIDTGVGDITVTFAIGDVVVDPATVRAPLTLLKETAADGALRFRIATVDARAAALAEAVVDGAVVPAAVRSRVEAIADRVAADLAPRLTLPTSLQGDLLPGAPRLVLRLALTDPLRLTARVSVVAGDGAGFCVPGAGAEVALALKDGVRVRYARNLASEVDLAAPLVERLADGLRLADNLQGADGDDRFTLAADDDAAVELFARAQVSGAEVVWRDQRRLQLAAAANTTALKVRVSSARQWLGLDGGADVDGEHVSLATLLAAVRHQRRYVKLAGDRFAAVSDELREALRGVAALTTDESSTDGGTAGSTAGGTAGGNAGGKGAAAGTVEVPFAVAPALDVLQQAGAVFEEGAVWQQMLLRLDRARAVDDTPPPGLRAELRPYQRDGLLFLRRLAAFGTGGVLADDMGLGKTVQAIGLLLDRQDEGPAVVVAPTSLVFNWLRELERFAPSLRVHVYGDANDRDQLLGALTKRDVLIATWGLLDERFAKRSFATAILDEAQAIKNADTQRARAARDLDATLKIALSGTPLENHLGELWSLFRVVSPGLLGSAEQFRKRFLLPIERDRSVQHRRQLGQTIRPFLLRRTKAEVLPELPPLTEQLVDVDASAEARGIYDALRTEILADLDDGSTVDDRRFRVLAGLTRLRLCCCHPVLVEPGYTGTSAKLDAAVATLEHVKAAGHKALVFSQFTKFLDLVEPVLKKSGLRLLRLDGSTPEAERRRRVDAFQRGEADVFLLSLKAGGAGLNLTAADVVVHLDPWWNPAVEAQAIARAHRLGRVEPVTAVRLVVRGTIEEAILRLHDEKRALVDAVLEGSGGGGALGLDDIKALLAQQANPEASALTPRPERAPRGRPRSSKQPDPT